MSELLTKSKVLIHEHLGLTSLTNVYDFFDPETKAGLGRAYEETCIGGMIARMFLDRAFLKVFVIIEDENGKELLHLESPPSFPCRDIFVKKPTGELIATFRKKFRFLGSFFGVVNPDGETAMEVSGDWRASEFRLQEPNGRVIGEITHRSSGIWQDMFTSADKYSVRLIGEQQNSTILLAAAIAVDLFFHED